jgi:phosphate transport system protein
MNQHAVAMDPFLVNQIEEAIRQAGCEPHRMTMWRKAADCWYDKEGKAADEIAQRDEEMDELQTVLVSEVAASGAPSSVAMELALVARFYERLGDHAVNVARMVSTLHEDSDRQRDVDTGSGRR